MTEAPFKILPTDQVFTSSPFPGDPDCICSRCGELIHEGDDPIRAWPENAKKEWRYHPACLGFKTFPDENIEAEGANVNR